MSNDEKNPTYPPSLQDGVGLALPEPPPLNSQGAVPLGWRPTHGKKLSELIPPVGARPGHVVEKNRR
jgi:hypothetical protein